MPAHTRRRTQTIACRVEAGSDEHRCLFAAMACFGLVLDRPSFASGHLPALLIYSYFVLYLPQGHTGVLLRRAAQTRHGSSSPAGPAYD